MEMENNNTVEEVKEVKKATRRTVKKVEKELNTNILYLKGQEFEETIEYDLSDNHSHKIDCNVYLSRIVVKGEDISLEVRWNRSRANYQGLVGTSQGTTSLSFFPHFDHCKNAIIKFVERMI